MRVDEDGELWTTALGIMLIGGIVEAGISAFSTMLAQKSFTGEVDWASVGVAALSGFVSSAVTLCKCLLERKL